MSGTTKQDYQDAEYSQSAVNASGLIHSLSKIVDRIWEDARAQGKGTEYVNTHPIMVYFATQLASLSGADRNYYNASDVIRDVLAGRIDPKTLEPKE